METKYLLASVSAPGGHEKEACYAYVELGPVLLAELAVRRALWAQTADADEDLAELVFRSGHCFWLRWIEIPEDKERDIDAVQWCWLDEPLPDALLDELFGEDPVAVRTELDEMVVWETGVFFRSVERNTDVLIESQVVDWSDLDAPGLVAPTALGAGGETR